MDNLSSKLVKNVAIKSRELIPEGMILLKNVNKTLPLTKNDKVSVFGRCQINFYISGTGSGGSVNVPYRYNLIDGLLENHIKINEELLNVYKNWIEMHPFDNGGGLWAGEPWNQEEMPISLDEIKKAHERSNKAIIIIGRTAGEDKDYKDERGSYRLTLKEKKLIEDVSKTFEHVILLLNVSNIIDMNEFINLPIDSIMYIWHGGMEGGRGVADALSGINPPSGHLPDSIVKDIKLYPSDSTYYDYDKVYYEDDIYVGYRFFNTFNKEALLYPFGYGLTYTTFEQRVIKAEVIGETINVEIEVTNIGEYKGKDCVQIYLSAPNGLLGRPDKELVGFKKTKMLNPNESETLKLSFNLRDFKTYDDLGVTGNKSCYVLEKGSYKLYLGEDSLNVNEIIFNEPIEVKSTIAVDKCNAISAPSESIRRVKRDNNNQLSYERINKQNIDIKNRLYAGISGKTQYRGDLGYRLIDVKNNKCSLDEFISQLTNEHLAMLVRGEGMCSPKVTPGVASCFGGVSEELIEKYGIPLVCTSDGPSGMRSDVGLEASLIPIGTLLASTFNDAIVEELFTYVGQELNGYLVDSLLGPGVNIHRHPLCGRNFEYFSEDPLLAGKMAASISRGLNRGGSSGTIKHMCCNNKEENRNHLDSIVSERALREIYLRPFEIAIKEGGFRSIMTSYNLINGFHASSSFDITKIILRDEWKYEGIVMTDWWALINDVITKGEENRQDLASMIRASNDLYMVVDNFGAVRNSSNDNILEALKNGSLTRFELATAVNHILNFILKSNKMNIISSLKSPLSIIEGRKDGATYYEAGRYTLYANMKMNMDSAAQGTSCIYLNDQFIAAAQTNGTNNKVVRKLLTRVELTGGYYDFNDVPTKNGIEIVSYELIKD